MNHLLCLGVGLPVAFAAGFLLASVLHLGRAGHDEEQGP